MCVKSVTCPHINMMFCGLYLQVKVSDQPVLHPQCNIEADSSLYLMEEHILCIS
jgi:hypothetical protein